MNLPSEKYKWLVTQIKAIEEEDDAFLNGVVFTCFSGDTTHFHYYEGEVVAKQRARVTKSGRSFTPKRTADFEKLVKEWGSREFSGNEFPVTYPLTIDIDIDVRTADKDLLWAGNHGLTYPANNDIDNMAKSILDALNGVLYKDDKQVVRLNLSKSWGKEDGFTLMHSRAGLNKSELENFRKYWDAANG